jgi:hypothetical protein
VAFAIFTNNMNRSRALDGLWGGWGHRILRRAFKLGSAQASDSGAITVTSSTLLEFFPKGSVSYELYLSHSTNHLDPAPATELTDEINRHAERVAAGDPVLFPEGIPVAPLLACPVVSAAITESAGRLAESIRLIIRANKITEAAVLTNLTFAERVAASVCRHEGIPVKILRSPLSLKLLSRLQQWAFEKRGLPWTARQYATQYGNPPGSELSAGRGKIFIFGTEERRLRRLPRLIEELTRRKLPFSVGTLPKKETLEASRELAGLGVRTEFVHRYLPRAEAEGMASAVEASLSKFWRSLCSSPAALAVRYCGVPLLALLGRRWEGDWTRKGAEASMFVHASLRFLRATRPAALVIFEATVHSSVLAAAARKENVPVILYLYNPFLFTARCWVPIIFQSVQPTEVVVATESMRAKLHELTSFPLDSISVAGDIYDRGQPTQQEVAAKKAVIYREHGIDLEKKLLLLLSGYVSQEFSYEKKRQFFENVWRATKNDPRIALIVKGHPNETIETLKTQLADWGIKIPVVHTVSLRDYVEASDLVAMTFSQAGIEVLQTGTPLLIIQDESKAAGYEEIFPFTTERGAAFVADTSDPRPLIHSLLFDEGARAQQVKLGTALVEKYISRNDGKSAEQLAEILAKYVDRASEPRR